MPKIYRILWSLAILFIIVTTVILSFGILLVGAAIAGLYGIYRYYFTRQKLRNLSFTSRNFSFTFRSKRAGTSWNSNMNSNSNRYYPGEVIDMPTEDMDPSTLFLGRSESISLWVHKGN